MFKNNFIILTGAMGSGKSTIINEIMKKDIKCIPEPARQILKEQRAIQADGVPEINSALFNQLMLSRSTKNYLDFLHKNKLIIFDRGIPDMIAYGELFGIDIKIYKKSSELYRYNKNIFCLKGWEEIYTTDDERKMDFQSANEFGEKIYRIYRQLGYNIITVPLISIKGRVDFILNKINELNV